ncbi:unnamed protein product [Citrullus colocynthis]|uniref:Uncharacterized protein n=1 Tax=Citrullus colocynthis TaxID=252529 RepID=A0ABP0XNT3_9ROSI
MICSTFPTSPFIATGVAPLSNSFRCGTKLKFLGCGRWENNFIIVHTVPKTLPNAEEEYMSWPETQLDVGEHNPRASEDQSARFFDGSRLIDGDEVKDRGSVNEIEIRSEELKA